MEIKNLYLKVNHIMDLRLKLNHIMNLRDAFTKKKLQI